MLWRYKRIINLYVLDNASSLYLTIVPFRCLLYMRTFSHLKFDSRHYLVHQNQNIDETKMKLWQFCKYVLSRMFRAKQHPHRSSLSLSLCGKLFLWRAKLQTFLLHSIKHMANIREREAIKVNLQTC